MRSLALSGALLALCALPSEADETYHVRGVNSGRAYVGSLVIEPISGVYGGGFLAKRSRYSLQRIYDNGTIKTTRGVAERTLGRLTLRQKPQPSLLQLLSPVPAPSTTAVVYQNDSTATERAYFRRTRGNFERLVLAQGLAHEPAPRVACVLMVEDEGRGRKQLTEPLGTLLYGNLLRRGYDEVRTLTGRSQGDAELAQAIREAAADNDAVDVFLSVHTTHRDPEQWVTAIGPAAAAKLRLVYSSACYGSSAERQAWEALSPTAVVTHVGTNNPLVALPYVLTEWVQGRPIGEAVDEGYRQTVAIERFVEGLPRGDVLVDYLIPAEDSQPVISGDDTLRIGEGLAFATRLPDVLTYDPRWCGALKVITNALVAEGYRTSGETLESAASSSLPGIPEEVWKNLVDVKIEDRLLKLRLRKATFVPVRGKWGIQFGETVQVRILRFDLQKGQLGVRLQGVGVGHRNVRLRVRTIHLTRVPLIGNVLGIGATQVPIGGKKLVAVEASVRARRVALASE